MQILYVMGWNYYLGPVYRQSSSIEVYHGRTYVITMAITLGSLAIWLNTAAGRGKRVVCNVHFKWLQRGRFKEWAIVLPGCVQSYGTTRLNQIWNVNNRYETFLVLLIKSEKNIAYKCVCQSKMISFRFLKCYEMMWKVTSWHTVETLRKHSNANCF